MGPVRVCVRPSSGDYLLARYVDEPGRSRKG